MKTVAAIAILCLGAAAARKPSRETASDRIEKLLAARGGKKSADRRWATAVNTLKSKTRRLSGDDDGDDDGGDDDYVPNCPTQYSAWQDCIQGLIDDGTVDGTDTDDAHLVARSPNELPTYRSNGESQSAYATSSTRLYTAA